MRAAVPPVEVPVRVCHHSERQIALVADHFLHMHVANLRQPPDNLAQMDVTYHAARESTQL